MDDELIIVDDSLVVDDEYLFSNQDSILSDGDNIDDIIDFQEVEVKTLRVSSSDSTGLKSSVLSIIGDYETVVTDYTYTSSNGYINHSIDVQPDYAWCISAFLFALCLWSCFRLFGLAFKRRG